LSQQRRLGVTHMLLSCMKKAGQTRPLTQIGKLKT
jgi:hypothetical protein